MTKDCGNDVAQGPAWQLLAEFSLPDDPGGEDRAMGLVTQAVHELALPPAQLDQLQVILKDVLRNAIQRSRSCQPGSAVIVRAFVQSRGSEDLAQGAAADEPGEQVARRSAQEVGQGGRYPVRGWGHFLIDRIIDSLGDPGKVARRAVELYLYQEGGEHGA